MFYLSLQTDLGERTYNISGNLAVQRARIKVTFKQKVSKCFSGTGLGCSKKTERLAALSLPFELNGTEVWKLE